MHRRWTVGALAELLGVAAPTLRTWERRYGIGPSHRTPGGHRRYTVVDADRVATLAKFISEGMAARDAAELVRRMSPHELAAVIASGPDGLRSSAREHAMAAIVAGAANFDGDRVQAAAEDAIERFGVVDAWDSTIGPALAEVGVHWADGRLGVAAERFVHGRLLETLRAQAHRHRVPGPSRVVLTTTDPELHKLPIVALGLALAHQQVASTELGAAVPPDIVKAFVRATTPDLLLLWSSVAAPVGRDVQQILAPDGPTRLLLAGAAWPPDTPAALTLAEAVEHVCAALGDELP